MALIQIHDLECGDPETQKEDSGSPEDLESLVNQELQEECSRLPM